MLPLIYCYPCLSHQQAFALPLAPSLLPGEADCSPLRELFLALAAVVAGEPSLASMLGKRT